MRRVHHHWPADAQTQGGRQRRACGQPERQRTVADTRHGGRHADALGADQPAGSRRAREQDLVGRNRRSRRSHLHSGVLLLAAATAWYWSGRGGMEAALRAGLAVLVVACPCSLGLAAPFGIARVEHTMPQRQIAAGSQQTSGTRADQAAPME